jgi:hypothetical protein
MPRLGSELPTVPASFARDLVVQRLALRRSLIVVATRCPQSNLSEISCRISVFAYPRLENMRR